MTFWIPKGHIGVTIVTFGPKIVTFWKFILWPFDLRKIQCHFEILLPMSPQKDIYRRPTNKEIQCYSMIFDYQSGAEKKSTDVLPRCRLSFSVTLKFDYRCRHKKISTDIQQRSTFDVTFRNMTANVTPEKISTDVLPRCRLSFRVTLKFDYRCRPEKISTDVLSRSKFSLS